MGSMFLSIYPELVLWARFGKKVEISKSTGAEAILENHSELSRHHKSEKILSVNPDIFAAGS